MKRKKSIKAVVGLALLWALVARPAQAAVELVRSTSSHVELRGDSTLHPFTSRTHDLTQAVRFDPPLASTAAAWEAILQKNALKQFQLSLPVKSLKSKESGLDKNMYKALKADTYTEITYALSRYDVNPSTLSAGGSRITAAGTLTIAGHSEPATLTIEASAAESALVLRGQYTLLMSQFGVKPPSLMLGAIKVRDLVTITFELTWSAVDQP